MLPPWISLIAAIAVYSQDVRIQAGLVTGPVNEIARWHAAKSVPPGGKLALYSLPLPQIIDSVLAAPETASRLSVLPLL